MSDLIQQKSSIWHVILVSAAVVSASSTAPARADVVMDWNAKADAIATEKQLGFPHNRAITLLHVAMFEAVNAIDRRYAPYKLDLKPDRDTSKEAAAASAGYEILIGLYPDQRTDLDGTVATMLAGIPDGEAKIKGVLLGKQAAAGIVALRGKGGTESSEDYRPDTAPGIYIPTVVPINSTVGTVTPWVMASSSQFRPSPPPALNSDVWTRDLNEIREVGGLNSTKRTPEQTTIGRFWFLTGPRTFNPIVRQVALAKKMDIVECARLYALVSMASHDAAVAVFEAKFYYKLWRPITAIRNADQTNNPATPRDPSWLPLGQTPMHPEYPCAHCITSTAVATVLGAVVGDDVGEISLTSPTAPGVTRRWTRLQDYSNEVALARIYAGFHYRFSTDVGHEMGKKIGALTMATQLRGVEASAAPRP
jgi:hypothetical protein